MHAHIPVAAGGFTVHFHVFVDPAGAEAKARSLAQVMARMPPQHLSVLFPILVIRLKPGGGTSGGFWTSGEVGIFREREAVTGVPRDAVERLLTRPGLGAIGIPLNRWQNPVSDLQFTLMHEVGHNVDHKLNMRVGTAGHPNRAATELDYQGVRPVCGGSNAVAKRVAEAYGRYLCRHPHICRDPVPGETPAEADARVIRNLRGSRAFRSVPSSWRP